MSLFGSPKVPAPVVVPTPSPTIPAENPLVTAARGQAQKQADEAVTHNIQDDLRRRMQSRLQRFGLVPAINFSNFQSGNFK
jgi:hypothetical protein